MIKTDEEIEQEGLVVHRVTEKDREGVEEEYQKFLKEKKLLEKKLKEKYSLARIKRNSSQVIISK